LWVVGLLLTVGIGILLLGVLGVVMTGELEIIFATFFYAAGAGIVSIKLFIEWRAWNLKREEWAVRMKALGLEFQLRVTTRDIKPYLDLPLFCFGDPGRQRADFLARGCVEGRDVVVMNYRYGGQFLTPKRRRILRAGIQTVALFPDVEGLPNFHLTPQEIEWNILAPDWVEEFEVGRVIRVADGYPDDPILIRSDDDLAAPLLFSPERLKRLGKLGGWTVECRDGQVAVYRHGEEMDTDELPYFVQRALDIVAVLTDREEAGARPSAGRDERVFAEPPRKWTERLQKRRRS
jgi:hypothetical protein